MTDKQTNNFFAHYTKMTRHLPLTLLRRSSPEILTCWKFSGRKFSFKKPNVAPKSPIWKTSVWSKWTFKQPLSPLSKMCCCLSKIVTFCPVPDFRPTQLFTAGRRCGKGHPVYSRIQCMCVLDMQGQVQVAPGPRECCKCAPVIVCKYRHCHVLIYN